MPRTPTLKAAHRARGIAGTNRAKMEQEIWDATHRDYRGYTAVGHGIMVTNGVSVFALMSDEAIAALYSQRVCKADI